MVWEWVVATVAPGRLSPAKRGTSMTAMPCTRRRRAGRHAAATPSSPQTQRANEEAKRQFYPWRARVTTGAATAHHCLAEHSHMSTYTQPLTFGSREKLAHKLVTGRVYHEG
jgi:hypothetical protein